MTTTLGAPSIRAGGPPMTATTLGAPSIRGFIADGWAVPRSATTAARLTPCHSGSPDTRAKATYTSSPSAAIVASLA